ncbi:MAG: glycine zipper 2TM domain-containing protein [Burkholderiales bacterium]
MKPTKLVIAALIGGSLLAAAPAFADPGYRHRGDRYEHHGRYDRDNARVMMVYREPARVYYAPPAPVYYTPPAPVYYAPRPAPAPVVYGYASPAGADAVAGAFAGAVIGSQLGHGPDRVVGAAFGSVLGAVIGSQLDYARY